MSSRRAQLAILAVLATPTVDASEFSLCGNYCGPGWCNGALTSESVCEFANSVTPTGSVDTCCQAHDSCCAADPKASCNTVFIDCLNAIPSSDSTQCLSPIFSTNIPASAVASGMALVASDCCGSPCPSPSPPPTPPPGAPAAPPPPVPPPSPPPPSPPPAVCANKWSTKKCTKAKKVSKYCPSGVAVTCADLGKAKKVKKCNKFQRSAIRSKSNLTKHKSDPPTLRAFCDLSGANPCCVSQSAY